MAQGNFENCLAVTLQEEGGYVNNPHDPGGATNYGITQRTFNAWKSLRGEAPVNVRYIEKSEVEDIYRLQYWQHVRGDELPVGVDLVVFDEGVNGGPRKSIKDLQRCLGRGLVIDGVFGLHTLRAVRSVNNTSDLITRICDWRLSWLHKLNGWRYFGKGWTNRVEEVRRRGLEMAR